MSFTDRPSKAQLQKTVFCFLLLLNLILALICSSVARFGLLRGIGTDLYLITSEGWRNALAMMHFASLVGFWLIWLASPVLRYQYRWIGLLAFIVGFLALITPG